MSVHHFPAEPMEARRGHWMVTRGTDGEPPCGSWQKKRERRMNSKKKKRRIGGGEEEEKRRKKK